MTEQEAILMKYPELIPGEDWYFMDDGSGPVLAKWPEGIPRLTKDDIDALQPSPVVNVEHLLQRIESLESEVALLKGE